ncbi:MAG: hypothetical protein MJZ61_03895 [Bacteroidales bacterium]|nr:hypothetical protein [Bacteroidales bacterium]
MIEREIKTYNQILRAKFAYQLADMYEMSNDLLNEIYDFLQNPKAKITNQGTDKLLFYNNDLYVKTVTVKLKAKSQPSSIIYNSGNITIIPFFPSSGRGGYSSYHSSGSSDSSYSGGSSNNNNNNNNNNNG